MHFFEDFKFAEKRLVFDGVEKAPKKLSQKPDKGLDDPINFSLEQLEIKQGGEEKLGDLQSEMVASLAKNFKGDAEIKLTKFDKVNAENSLRETLQGAVVEALKPTNVPEVAGILNASAVVIAQELENKIFQPARAGGVDLAKVEGSIELDLSIDAEKGLIVKPKFVGQIAEQIDALQKIKGEEAVAGEKPEEDAEKVSEAELKKRIEKMKGGVLGTIVGLFFGVATEKDWIAVAKGEHFASNVFGLVSYHTKGEAYPWMYDKTKKMIDKSKKNEKTRGFAEAIVGGSAALLPFYEFDRDSDESAEVANGPKEVPAAKLERKLLMGAYKVGESGEKLKDVLVSTTDTFKAAMKEGMKIVFPGETEVEIDGVAKKVTEIEVVEGQRDKLVRFVKGVPAGTVMAEGIEIFKA